MTVEITGLSKLDAIELRQALGESTVRRASEGRSADKMQDLGTTTLVLLLLTPEIIAGVVAWLLKPRRRTKITLVSTSETGASERLEIEATESDQLDPQILERLAKMSRQPVAEIKRAIDAGLKKNR